MGLQFPLLVGLGGLGGRGVLTELLATRLRIGQGVLRRPVVQPRQCLLDPRQELREREGGRKGGLFTQ